MTMLKVFIVYYVPIHKTNHYAAYPAVLCVCVCMCVRCICLLNYLTECYEIGTA